VALLGNLTGSSQFFSDELFYNDVATQSLRFDDGSSAYLSRTFSTPTNNKIWTFSTWVKRSNLGINYPTMFSRAIDSSNYFQLRFDLDSELITVFDKNANSNYILLQTTPKYRDTSSWYHILVAYDTTQSTSSDRVKLYVNGEQVIDFSTATYPAQNYAPKANTAGEHKIGTYSTSQHFDGYLSEVNFVDGQALTPSSFGETKNGVWIPIKYTGSYGTNGYRLQFKQTGVGTASSSTIGADTSGNNNHWASSGIAASDCALPDSPENNFATMNPLIKSGNTFSEGNLKVTTTTTTPAKFVSTLGVTSGKWFMEFRHSGDGNYPFGITSDTQQRDYLGMSDGSTSVSIWGTSSNSNAFVNGSQVSWGGSGTTWSAGDIIGLALNADDSILEVYKNGSSVGSYDYSGLNWSEHFFAGGNYVAGTYSPNFGQDSTFQGAISAGGNADAKGIGDFKHSVPSSYLALCTSNLPEVTISPNSLTQADDHFNTVLYTGNATARSITGVGFQPDWVWSKARGLTQSHRLVDSSRGVQKSLYSNLTNAEATESGLTAFNADGFSIGTETSFNYNTEAFVAWNWKANGGTTTTNDASATSIGDTDSVIQANTDAGFSIVTYTGFSGSSGTATVAHGLSQAPEIIIHKSRTRTSAWWIQAPNVLSTPSHFLEFTTATPYELSSYGTMSAPTSSVFSINGVDGVGGESANYIAYCFHSVEGYSRFGSYTGNGNADGTFVYTGFRPAFLMIKNTTSSADWVILDTKRNTYNPVQNNLYPSSTATEGTGNLIDYVSNGFKCRFTYSTSNNDAKVYIYMAFAENPFKYANAR